MGTTLRTFLPIVIALSLLPALPEYVRSLQSGSYDLGRDCVKYYGPAC